MEFPEDFVAQTAALEFIDGSRLLSSLETEPCCSVRYNTAKIPVPEGSDTVPWWHEGAYLAERPYFTTDPAFRSGGYYVQEASSMYVGHILSHLQDLPSRIRLLDLCASPGGKATLYSSVIGDGGLVVANEVVRKRVPQLVENIQKWGLGNVAVTCAEPAVFEAMPGWFDVVAVDAPCSGEGMFRKDRAAMEQWSLGNVRMCAQRQREILSAVWTAIRPGGYLIYSTCTFNACENEENVCWMIRELGCQPVNVPLDSRWGITVTDALGARCMRFLPCDIRGEGFFVTVLRKPDGPQDRLRSGGARHVFSDVSARDCKTLSEWVLSDGRMIFRTVGDRIYCYDRDLFEDVRLLSERLPVIYSGVCMGQLFSGVLRPAHALSLYSKVSRTLQTDVSVEQALLFMSRQSVDTSLFREGMNLVTCMGMPLGWAKRIGTRVNSLLPKEWAVGCVR